MNKVLDRLKFIIILASVLLSACEQPRHDDVLASVYGKNLYLKDIGPYLTDALSPTDSLGIITKHVDKWVMDQILIDEAEKNLTDKTRIEALVRKYRTELVIHELEKHAISEMSIEIDSTELDSLSAVFMMDMTLQEDIVKYLLVKVPIAFDNDTLTRLWKTEDLVAMRSFVNMSKGRYYLDLDRWYTKAELKVLLPSELYKKINFSKTENYSYSDTAHKFYIKILEFRKEKEAAPQEFVSEKLKHQILHDRSKKFLNNWKMNLYQNKIQSKDIYVHDK